MALTTLFVHSDCSINVNRGERGREGEKQRKASHHWPPRGPRSASSEALLVRCNPRETPCPPLCYQKNILQTTLAAFKAEDRAQYFPHSLAQQWKLMFIKRGDGKHQLLLTNPETEWNRSQQRMQKSVQWLSLTCSITQEQKAGGSREGTC